MSTDPKAPQPLAEVLAFRPPPAEAESYLGDDPAANAELLDNLLAGASEAAGALYDRFAPRVNGLVWRLLGADGDHDDVVQQVFLAILQSAERIRSPEALPAWITQVTVNTVRKEIRRRQRWRWFQAEAAAQPTDHGPDGEDQLLARRFYQVLGRMTPDDQLALSLRYVEGLTLPEVAAACGYSLATAKRRLVRARTRFEKRAQRDFVLAAKLEGWRR